MRVQGLSLGLLGIVVSVAVLAGGAATTAGGTTVPVSPEAGHSQLMAASVTPFGDDDPGPFNESHI